MDRSYSTKLDFKHKVSLSSDLIMMKTFFWLFALNQLEQSSR